MDRLRKRAEFLAVATGSRAPSRAFTLQARLREPMAPVPPRFGFTVTKKTGNSVERNRIRRRLREAVRRMAPLDAKPGFDYVLIGRRDALQLPFQTLTSDLAAAFKRVHARQSREPPR